MHNHVRDEGVSKKEMIHVPCKKGGCGRRLRGGAHGVELVVHPDGGRLAGAAVAQGRGGRWQVAEGSVDEHLAVHGTAGGRDDVVSSQLGAPRQSRRVHVHVTAPHGRRSATDGQRGRGPVDALRTQLHRHGLRVDLQHSGGTLRGRLCNKFQDRSGTCRG